MSITKGKVLLLLVVMLLPMLLQILFAVAPLGPAYSVTEEQVFVTPTRIGTHSIPEGSGIIASRVYPDIYWMISDWGNPANLYAVDGSGQTVKILKVEGAKNGDWEDIAIDENNNIWIAEIGDNDAVAPGRRFYKVSEPDPYGSKTSVAATIYDFKYPDGPRDANSAFVWQGIPYVIDTHRDKAKVYKLPVLDPNSVVTAELVATYTGATEVRGADISPDGKRLALVSALNDYALVIERDSSSTDVKDFFSSPTRQWRISFAVHWLEGITFIPGKYDFIMEKEYGGMWKVTEDQYNPSPRSFSFSMAGDWGGNTFFTDPHIKKLNSTGADFAVFLGDLSYSSITPESAWCKWVKDRVGSQYPIELLAGNHEDNGPDGLIENFAACLPHRLDSPITGTYGKEYYFDYPSRVPLARFILVSPGLMFTNGGSYNYSVGSAHYNFVVSAIDDARAKGIPWVIVGMHVPCISAGAKKACWEESNVEPFYKVLLAKKVDLILQAHDHNYQRSKQLSCVTVGTFNPSCVVDDGADGLYTKGFGSVTAIVGTGGHGNYPVNASDTEAGYFAKINGDNRTIGHLLVTITSDSMRAKFNNVISTFTDSFSIVSSTTPALPTVTLTASPASVPADGTSKSTITAQLSDNKASVAVSFTTTLGILSSAQCVTGSGGSCTTTITSLTAGTAIITGSASGYNSGSTSVNFTTPPPPPGPVGYTLKWESYDAEHANEVSVLLNDQLILTYPSTEVPANNDAWISMSMDVTKYVVSGTNTLVFRENGGSGKIRNVVVADSNGRVVFSDSTVRSFWTPDNRDITYTFAP